MLHLGDRILCGPPLNPNPIQCDHDARAVFSTHAVNEHRMQRRIRNQVEKAFFLDG